MCCRYACMRMCFVSILAVAYFYTYITYITYYSIAYVTLVVCVCTMPLGFRNQIASRQLCYLAVPFGGFVHGTES